MKKKKKLSELAKLFLLYNQETGKTEPVKLSEGQEEIFDVILNRKPSRVHVMTPTQYGKKIGDDIPVRTNTGWKNHGDLEIGDIVFSPEGKQIKVIDILNDGKDIDYEIEFTNSEKITCHGQHEWIVLNKNWKTNKYRKLETQEIAKQNYKIFSLPNISPLQFNKQELPIDPYVLGCWLGDGTSSSGTICFHEKDSEHIDKINELGYKSKSIWGKTELKNTTILGIRSTIKELGLTNNKHIPDIYKNSSIEQRLELLAGIIDTDGHVNKEIRENGWKNGRVYIANINKRLIDDFVEVIHSLGMRTSVTKVEPMLSTSGIQGKNATYYIGFQPLQDIPTAIPRKKIVGQEKKKRIRIRNIKKIKPINGKCITAEGGVYLVGKTMIPTHNSHTVAMAVLLRAITHPEKWAVVAPSHPKAMIIMRYIIDHCYDNEIFRSQLDMDETAKDRLKREVSKTRLTFKGGGEIFVLSADSRNKAQAGETLMGFGAANIILDESSLIDDDIYAKIKRMLGGHKDNFLLEIGNPFKRNHFLRNFHSDDYHKITIDYKRAIKEERLTKEFVEEMRKEAFFDILYECKFPKQDMLDSDGWTVLLSEDDITNAFLPDNPNTYGEVRLGVDVARSGGNFNVWVLRTGNFAQVLGKSTTDNLMDVIGTTKDFAEKFDVAEENIFIDATGLGAGVSDRFVESGWNVSGINMAQKAIEQDKYINIRAEAYIRARNWIKAGGQLKKDSDFLQLIDMKYKVRSNGKIKIIDKETLRKSGIPSPDVADAFMLTFCRPEETFSFMKKRQIIYNKIKQPVYE